MKTKKPTLLEGKLEGRCVEICLHEVMSPSPGQLLFDASAQSPPSDKTYHIMKNQLSGNFVFLAYRICLSVLKCGGN